VEDIAAGFVGDVGDLMKLVLAKKGIRPIPGVDQKLGHELADCLWSILILADKYEIDLENSFVTAMNELEHRLAQK
jgi:NTP pyrophosphatase (non-canonical NTP hydrolase)